jgi:hypothetical protein
MDCGIPTTSSQAHARYDYHHSHSSVQIFELNSFQAKPWQRLPGHGKEGMDMT